MIKRLVYFFPMNVNVCRPELVFAMNNDPKIMGLVLPKKWSGQNLTDLTNDYGPVSAGLNSLQVD